MIDAHVHFWRYQQADYPWIALDMDVLRRDRLPDDRVMQGYGIDGCIAVQARCCEAENDFLLDLAAQYECVLGVVGWLDFCAVNIDERLAHDANQSAMCGYRHIVQDEADPSAFLARQDFNHGIARLQQHDMTYDVLVQQKDLDATVDFCARHDRAWLVLDHLGKPEFAGHERRAHWQKKMRALAAMEHVAVKLSGVLLEAGVGSAAEDVFPYWADALTYFGAERCLWGSDWPVCLLAHEDGQVMDAWQQFAGRLSTTERSAVEEQTARHVYRLEKSV